MSDVYFKNIGKRYTKEGAYVLHDFDLKIKDGELVVIVGPSGSGKSTLLELICGFEAPTCGEIQIEGASIVNKVPSEREIGMVFQNYALLPHMTVYENIAFGMKVRKDSKQKIKEKVEWAMRTLNLEAYREVKPAKLSGGQRQRVALARAMVREPKLFLMDEPLSNLDAKLRESMCLEIKKLQESLKTTMIYVTHDQVEAMTLADRIVILKEGRIQQVGTPYEIYHQPANLFVAQFIGRPSINTFTCNKSKQGLILENKVLIEGSFEFLKEKDYLIGIRSEAITIVEAEQEAHLKAEVIKVDCLGSETLLHLRHEIGTLIAKDYQNNNYHPNTWVNIKIDLKQVYYFDAQTEQRIEHRLLQTL